MKKLIKIALVSSLTLLCFSCYYDEFLEEEEVVIDPDEVVSFENDIQPIFSTNCIVCHNADRDPDLREGNAHTALVPEYVTAFDPENSLLYNRLPGIGHPIDAGFSLSDNDIALIYAWIDRGALNN